MCRPDWGDWGFLFGSLLEPIMVRDPRVGAGALLGIIYGWDSGRGLGGRGSDARDETVR